MAYTKEQKKARAKEYYARHRAELLENQKRYYLEHHEERIEYQREYDRKPENIKAKTEYRNMYYRKHKGGDNSED